MSGFLKVIFPLFNPDKEALIIQIVYSQHITFKMKDKIWLSIEPQILGSAQQLAKNKKISFSKLIEDQLRLLIEAEAKKGDQQRAASVNKIPKV